MAENPNATSRRRFVRLLGSVVASIPVVSLISTRTAAARTELIKLSEREPAAVGLGYRHDATQVDVTMYPKRGGETGASQFCRNCTFYGADSGSDWGPCSVFPGKTVASGGWCNAWANKA